MTQLPLFDTSAIRAQFWDGRGRLDDDSEHLLGVFQEERLVGGAHPRSVKREVSQLRAISREAGLQGQPATLRACFADLDLVAQVLREPRAVIARSTGRARLLAVQRFVRIMDQALGRNPTVDLAALDELLPSRPSTGWHSTGTLVAGTSGRRRRRGPTLDAADLRRIVDAAGDSAAGATRLRDRTLVALHCFSGLRPEEIVRLRWEDLATNLASNGHFGLMASIERRGRYLRLLVPAPAADEIERLATTRGGQVGTLSGPVFHARGASDRAISYRAARVVLQNACRQAGLPAVDSTVLRAACAHWLRGQGLSDHEVAMILGLARVRSVDRLLERHAALDAQRTVRERLDR